MPEWRNGRRAGLKIPYPQGCVGSTPTSGTTTYATRGTLEERRFNLGSTSCEGRTGARACMEDEAGLIIVPCSRPAVHPACR